MDPLPPETTTPMPPQLHTVAPRLFPNHPDHIPEPEDHVGHFVVCDLICGQSPPKPHITPRPSRWPRFIQKMSAPIDSVQP